MGVRRPLFAVESGGFGANGRINGRSGAHETAAGQRLVFLDRGALDAAFGTRVVYADREPF